MMVWRPYLLKIHRWIAIFFGVFLLFQGLTGALLIYRDELELVLHPSLEVEPGETPVPIQLMLSNVREAYPELTVRRVDLPPDASGVAMFHLDGPRGDHLVAVDPWRGSIVRSGGIALWPGELLFELHHALLAGKTGEAVVGLAGISLLILAISGPIVWWPGMGNLRKGLRLWRGRGAEPLLRSLHRSTGIVLVPLIVFSATTGTLMSFKQEFREVLRLSGSVIDKPNPVVSDDSGNGTVAVDDLIKKAQADYGPGHLQQLRFPGGTGRIVTIYLEYPGAVRPDAADQIWYDVYTGDELGRYLVAELPTRNRVIDWLYPLHTGTAGGDPLKLVLLLGGLGLAGMSASGYYIWLGRRSRKRHSGRSARLQGA